MKRIKWLYILKMKFLRWWFYNIKKMHHCDQCGADMRTRDNFCWDCGFNQKKFDDDYMDYCLKQKPIPCEVCKIVEKQQMLWSSVKDGWVCNKCWDESLKT